MPRRRARDARIVEVTNTAGELSGYSVRFKYKDAATNTWKEIPKQFGFKKWGGADAALAEATRWLDEQDGLANRGKAGAQSKQPLGLAIKDWLEEKQTAGKIIDATRDNQQNQLAAVYGGIFGVPLCDLRGHHFEGEYRRIKQQGKPGGSVAAYTHSLLNGWFNRLVKAGKLTTNPLEHVLKPEPDPKPKRAWDWDQIVRFLRHQERATMYPLWLLMLQHLLRVGEAQALRWCDVEIDGSEGTGRVHITATVTRIRDPRTGKMVWAVGERAKTPGSTRTVMIDWEVQRSLRKHRDRALFAARAFGRAWDDRHFIFADRADTTFLDRDTICYHLKKACDDAGVDYLGNHGLRRTGISRRLAEEPLFYVMADAGHEDPKTTKGYAVISESERRTWAKRFAVRVHGERDVQTAPQDDEAKSGD